MGNTREEREAVAVRRADIRALAETGLGATAIAVRTGLPFQTVRNDMIFLRGLGYLPKGKRRPDTIRARVLELAEQGLDNAEIAERAGTSPGAVRVIKSRNGIRRDVSVVRLRLPPDLAQWLREDCPEGRLLEAHCIQCLEFTRSYSAPRKRGLA